MTEKPQIVLFGNPGVGKSTLLNTIAGTHKFRSGLSIGWGLTKDVQEEEDDKYKYVDTPGLDDDSLRQHATKELSNALRAGGRFKLIFVATLEAGRIRARDVAVMHIVLSAIEAAGHNPASAYSIMLNKCTEAEMSAFINTSNLQQVASKFAWRGQCPHVYMIARLNEATNVDNVQLATGAIIKNYVQACVEMRLPEGNGIDIDFNGYEDRVEELEEQLRTLRNAPVGWRAKLPQIVRVTCQILGFASVALAIISVPGILRRLGGLVFSQLLGKRSNPQLTFPQEPEPFLLDGM